MDPVHDSIGLSPPLLAAGWRPVLDRWRGIPVAWTLPKNPSTAGGPHLEAAIEYATAHGFLLRAQGGYAAYYTYIDLAIGAIIPREAALRRALARAESRGGASADPAGAASPAPAVLAARRAGLR